MTIEQPCIRPPQTASHQPRKDYKEGGLMFAQNDGRQADIQVCHRCGGRGCISQNCPAEKPMEQQMHTIAASDEESQEGSVPEVNEDELSKGSDSDGDDIGRDYGTLYFFCQHSSQSSSGLSKDWLLLDSQSSTDMFCSKKYLCNIKLAKHATIIHFNVGSIQAMDEGIFDSDIFGDIPIKCNPRGICNLISLKTMKKLFPITYQSSPDDGENTAFQVHATHGIIEFKPCNEGLHYMDLMKHSTTETLCIQTVQGNYKGTAGETSNKPSKHANYIACGEVWERQTTKEWYVTN